MEHKYIMVWNCNSKYHYFAWTHFPGTLWGKKSEMEKTAKVSCNGYNHNFNFNMFRQDNCVNNSGIIIYPCSLYPCCTLTQKRNKWVDGWTQIKILWLQRMEQEYFRHRQGWRSGIRNIKMPASGSTLPKARGGQPAFQLQFAISFNPCWRVSI